MPNNKIQSISVIGAGQMGHQIAMLAALGGFNTILQDVQETALQSAKEKLEAIMAKWVQKGKLSEDNKLAAFTRLQYTTDLEKAANHADLIIEAVVEKLEVKQKVDRKSTRLNSSHWE